MSRVTEALRRAREEEPHLHARTPARTVTPRTSALRAAQLRAERARAAKAAMPSTPSLIHDFVRDFQELARLWNGADPELLKDE